MSTNITIPDFDFAKFYYGEILDSLIQFKRRYVPELTDETPYEPFIQILRAFALVGHLNNTNLDLIANEAYLSTAKLVESVREHLRLIDYQLRPAVPSQVDELYELSAPLLATTEVVPANSLISTVGSDDAPEVFFEALTAVTSEPTNVLSHVFAYIDDEEPGSHWVDYTIQANTASPGAIWTPWPNPTADYAIYFGHTDAMWDKLSFTDISTPGADIASVWEFYGNHFYTIPPTEVDAESGTDITFVVDSIVGTDDRTGTDVRVTLNSTGAFEDLTVVNIVGENRIVTSDNMGQSSPSEITTDYTLSMPWYELSSLTDATYDTTSPFEQDGNVEYALPQSLTENWQKVAVNLEEAYWIRCRIISVGTPTAPTLRVVQIDQGNQYVITSVIQGQTRLDEQLITSNGSPDQSAETTQDYFILNSETVTVDDEEWISVDNFLSSKNTSKHYTVTLGDNDRATINFGDGVLGFIPPTSSIVDVEYRYNAELDGNVGSETIISDRSGLVSVSGVTNPRAASGWAASQGSDEQSLEQAKIEGPASLRIKEVALNADDVESLAVSYVDDNGTSPFVRSAAFEGTYGPKTLELTVVAAGGGVASSEQLDAVEKYFNGDKTVTPVKPKRIVANQELSAGNYTQKEIDVTATVTGDVEQSAVETALARILQPEALDDDGLSYLWGFGGQVPVSRLIHEIFNIDADIKKVVISEPSSDVELDARSLPVAGTITITIEADV